MGVRVHTKKGLLVTACRCRKPRFYVVSSLARSVERAVILVAGSLLMTLWHGPHLGPPSSALQLGEGCQQEWEGSL